jgi:hypothetical protein
MFGRFFGKEDTSLTQPSQPQSMSGVNVNGGQVLQEQAGRDGTVAQTQKQGLSGTEVVALLKISKEVAGSTQ